MRKQDFQERLRAAERPVVVDVWAPWCGPCLQIAPHLERLSEEFAGQVDLWRVNSDEEPDVAQALEVRGIPTLIAFQGETQVARRVGALPPDGLRELFEAALSGEEPSRRGMSTSDRGVRLFAGAALLVFTWYTGGFWLLYIIALLILLSAVHDYLPSVGSLLGGSPGDSSGDSSNGSSGDA
jgi:thioredoxin